eukprot:6492749-Amphidinium_carterae.2
MATPATRKKAKEAAAKVAAEAKLLPPVFRLQISNLLGSSVEQVACYKGHAQRLENVRMPAIFTDLPEVTTFCKAPQVIVTNTVMKRNNVQTLFK